MLPLEEALSLFRCFNVFDVCVMLWVNCLEDFDKRNSILNAFNAKKGRCEKI